MSLAIVRFSLGEDIQWGLKDTDGIKPLNIPCTTTAALINMGYTAISAACDTAQPALDETALSLLSPITADAKVMCQGANYRQHMLDSGMDPDAKAFNMFFTKSSASIFSPRGEIIRPAHVQLLDYEVELTLVLGKKTCGEIQVTAENLHEYVAGICIGNDISARDVQIPQMQFHKGKSYRTFCPMGPVLYLLRREEMQQLNNMQLSLSVNGKIRQQDCSANMVFKPVVTIREYSQIADFNPGDVIMTGTPAGCAMALPSALLIRMAALLPEKTKWALFHKKQLARREYLQPGDTMECSIKSLDGKIDLGTQVHRIISAGVA